MIDLFSNPISGFMIPLLIWSLVWKGVALWKAARHSQKEWFIALLIMNTGGLLEIAYLLWFQKGHRR